MPSTNFNTIKAVIDKTTPPLQAIETYFQGDPSGSTRKLWPHVLGTNNGKEMVLCYQYDGHSERPLVKPHPSKKNFRCFELIKLKDPTNPANPNVKVITFTPINPPPPAGQTWTPFEFKFKDVKRQNCVDEDEVETFR
jgi:hypothetical protein